LTEPPADAFIAAQRARIADVDRALVAALNRRLELVAELKRYKEAHGIAFVDPERERALTAELEAANRGPLSAAGLRVIHTEILALTKRELP
jgi:chorismate mutase